ncbi:MAG: FG-GAP repeat protein, partial [Myxococcota bacterium]
FIMIIGTTVLYALFFDDYIEFCDFFGFSVALSVDTLAVGAYFEDSYATGVNGDQTRNAAVRSGAVYVFTRSNGMWRQEAYLKASNTDVGDSFGLSVALSGDTLAVGSGDDSDATGVNGDQTSNAAPISGAVYVRRVAP